MMAATGSGSMSGCSLEFAPDLGHRGRALFTREHLLEHVNE